MKKTGKIFKWGIWGTGDVARKFALGLKSVDGATAAWVLSRDQARAEDLARNVGAAQGHTTLADAGPADAVYIATSADLHADHAVAALEAGLPVLVEKPFATKEVDARRIVDTAQAANLFTMEAMWTRFQPAIAKAAALIENGAIGTPRLLRGEVCIASKPGGSHYCPDGGGALLQRGIYPLSLATHFLGVPEEAQALLTRGYTDVDEDITVQLRHPGGALSQIRASLTTNATNTLEILGDRGALRFEGRIWRPSALRVSSYAPRHEGGGNGGRLANLRETAAGQSLQRLLLPLLDRRGSHVVRVPVTGNGYGHQAEAMMAGVASGALESPVMPLAESVALTALMERLLREKQNT